MRRRHAVLLWVLCPLLLWLDTTRPFVSSGGRAQRLPHTVGRFAAAEDYPLSANLRALLGTDDVLWRRYESPELGSVFVVGVFHRANWKSVHPPHTCLRGSNMQLVEDDRVSVQVPGGGSDQIGRLSLTDAVDGRRYLSYYAYVAPGGLLTGSYWQFFLHHAPLALLRRGEGGCLLRVETWVDGDRQAAEARCRAFVEAVLPELRELLR